MSTAQHAIGLLNLRGVLSRAICTAVAFGVCLVATCSVTSGRVFHNS
jgi:hypothetical protein